MGALSPATTAAHDHMDYFARVPANGQLRPALIFAHDHMDQMQRHRNPFYLTVATLVDIDACSPCLRVVAHACALRFWMRSHTASLGAYCLDLKSSRSSTI